MPFNFASIFQTFEGISCLHVQSKGEYSSTQKIEATGSSSNLSTKIYGVKIQKTVIQEVDKKIFN
jgi:hypothetical protein